jgi:uncharacterized membrane protein SpoIIM required for sporulation
MATTLDSFLTEREPAWAELEGLLARAKRKPERLGAAGVLRLGALYRSTAADLAQARQRYPHDPVVRRLEHLVSQARHLVYDAPPGRVRPLRFFGTDYWRLIAERPGVLVVSLLLVFGPALAAALWALHDPAAATGLVPGEFRPALESKHPWTDFGAGDQAGFTSMIFTHNIEVTFAVFAAGITLGIGSAFLLIQNGVLLGAVGGLMIQAGNGTGFLDLVTAHGILEMTCIVVAGASGLRMGWAIVSPGTRTRQRALSEEALAAVQIALGTAPWLVVAGVLEGNRAHFAKAGLPVVVGTGLVAGGAWWVLLLWRGRAPRGAAEG